MLRCISRTQIGRVTVHLRGRDILSEHLLPDAVLCVIVCFLVARARFLTIGYAPPSTGRRLTTFWARCAAPRSGLARQSRDVCLWFSMLQPGRSSRREACCWVSLLGRNFLYCRGLLSFFRQSLCAGACAVCPHRSSRSSPRECVAISSSTSAVSRVVSACAAFSSSIQYQGTC